MPPKAHRSRACNQCRERRVKCDETPETCQQCRRLGLECSGPLQGSVIIDMTDRIAKPRQRKKRTTRPAIVIREDAVQELPKIKVESIASTPVSEEIQSPLQVVLSPNQKLPLSRRVEMEADEAIAAIRSQYKLPMLYQPSKIQSEALDLAFISHFIRLNHGVRSYAPEVPWITHLPAMHTKASKPALRLSIRAASMAFYAQVHRDPTIMVDSYRWYTMSLNSQRTSLSKLGTQSIPDEEEILVPIILSLYEVFAGTTSTSILQHLTAAANIIRMRGPKNCNAGVAHPLFKAMRVSDAHKAMIFNQPSVFSSHEWMTVPFENRTRNAHHVLTDVLLKIPDCISLCGMGGSMRSFFSTPLRSNIELISVRERASELLRDLRMWAEANYHLTSASGSQVVSTDMSSMAISGAKVSSPDPTMIVLPESFVALTAATYEAVHLILTLLLHKISSSTQQSPASSVGPDESLTSTSTSLLDTATRSSQSIIETTAYLESTHPIGFDFMRSVFPLVVVAVLGPRPEEQKTAKQMLDRWGKKRGMGGLCGAWLHI